MVCCLVVRVGPVSLMFCGGVFGLVISRVIWSVSLSPKLSMTVSRMM